MLPQSNMCRFPERHSSNRAKSADENLVKPSLPV